MKDWFYEMLIVLDHSKRTQWAIMLGILAFIFINLLGWYMLRDFQLSSSMQPMTEGFKYAIWKRYDSYAFGTLFSFWVLAVKLYSKDKKRLLG